MKMKRRHPGSQVHLMMEASVQWGGQGVASTVEKHYTNDEDNLIMGENAGIFDDVKLCVSHGVTVKDYAVVYGNAKIRHLTEIYGSAKVYDDATIGAGSENRRHVTKIYGNAEVYHNAKVDECAKVYGNARIYGSAHVYGHAKVFGCADISENAKICDNVEISGNAWIHGNAKISGKLKISGDVEIDTGVYYSKEELELQNMEDLERLSPNIKYENEIDLEKIKALDNLDDLDNMNVRLNKKESNKRG